jgi:2-succinyl-6-hydroxy-2,4-cyclohexadiene-1-carboxylate synthase
MAEHHRLAQYTGLPARRVGARTGQDARPAAGRRAPPVVLLHGFTQTGASWGPLLPYLSHLEVVLPDLPGHGAAGGVGAALWETADLLSELVSAPAMWVGYSLGGRTALHVALSHPEVVERLVLVSATAGIEDDGEREARRLWDEGLAARLETEGTEEFLRWWLSQPLFASLPPERAGRAERAANSAAGLASSLRRSGTGSQSPLWARLGELGARQLPVLCLSGALDTRYVAIAARMAEAIGPTAAPLVVEGAGHACHLERPEQVGPALARFSEGEPGRQ